MAAAQTLQLLWSGVKNRVTVRQILFVAIVALLACVGYIHFHQCPSSFSSQNVCSLLKESRGDLTQASNRTRAWWEWACLIEKELDKGEEYKCWNLRNMGNWPVCFDSDYQPKAPCLVYSFGINNDFRFDDAMAAEGCEVFSFDPSMGVGDHEHAKHVTFRALGLSDHDSDTYQPNVDGYVNDIVTWKVRTLKSIRKMLGHENRALDVLKMDIETYEWAVVKNLQDDGQLSSVRQLALEWHIFPTEPFRNHFSTMYQTMLDLKKIGFRQFYMSPWNRIHNIYYFNSQADNCLVNTMFQAPQETRSEERAPTG
ncbi:hypothetical protein C0Q70_09719 [Pomacea canaliculata]|uniref:Methyltransferase domain-containing protein n=1 Tax=Pomacea canaliculata TaxID=400727 RepID=A0A2T7PAL5_POMCA|nr:methyltransferase-like protein 24 [Pomacea canaliculata]XP_025094821.1 methyltransferase-like protein 24 [Pomacea canaliculata]XP_025094822.1 methyltransferase-like protein 24 [Pomacea canaliculata]XP_025094823.1 methyltransferase-like protein 24 [Pomacea canaliculata]PVD30453.1 hypothetical protein C0Q70_09719 [Pomacea canaliculata]